MIKLEKTEVFGWEAAIRGMRNPMNSWDRSDSTFNIDGEYHDICGNSGPTNHDEDIIMGRNDHDLMMRLSRGGPVHAKYRRMITVYVDITAPLYWWKEFDTYKVGTVANSCSTMHKIADKKFTRDDFSTEHLVSIDDEPRECRLEYEVTDEIKLSWSPSALLNFTIAMLNKCREYYLETKDKIYWWQMIQLLPSSYNQKRTIMLNYEVLASIYKYRMDHKLDEWREFCKWIKTLPYSEIIIGEKED